MLPSISSHSRSHGAVMTTVVMGARRVRASFEITAAAVSELGVCVHVERVITPSLVTLASQVVPACVWALEVSVSLGEEVSV